MKYCICMTLLVLLISCSPDVSGTASEAGNSSAYTLQDSLFIKMPSSVTDASRSVRTGDSSNAIDLYSSVKSYIHIADEVVHNEDMGLIAMLKFWRDLINWETVEKWGVIQFSHEDFHYTASYDSTAEFAYRLTMREELTVEKNIALDLFYNGDEAQPKGKAYYHIGRLGGEYYNTMEIAVTFNNSGAEKNLAVSLSEKVLDSTDDMALRTMQIVMYEKDSLISFSGSSYLPLLDSVLPDTTGYCYTYVGATDKKEDRAQIHLGLPPATIAAKDSATLFETYGIERIYLRAFMSNELSYMEEDEKRFVATACKENVALQVLIDSAETLGSVDFLLPASEIESVTVDEFIAFLELSKDGVDSETANDFKELLWIAYLKQPVYFDQNGYVGNGSTVPIGFEKVATESKVMPLFSPLDVSTLVIAPEGR